MPPRLALIVENVIPLIVVLEKVTVAILEKALPFAQELGCNMGGVDHAPFILIRAVHIARNGVETGPREVIKSIPLVQRGFVICLACAERPIDILDDHGPRLFRRGDHIFAQPDNVIFECAKNHVCIAVLLHEDVGIPCGGGIHAFGDQGSPQRVLPWAGGRVGAHDANLMRSGREIPIPFAGALDSKGCPTVIKGLTNESRFGPEHTFQLPVDQIA